MEKRRKRVAVIGCTGSVGSSALAVCRAYPQLFQVTAWRPIRGGRLFPPFAVNLAWNERSFHVRETIFLKACR